MFTYYSYIDSQDKNKEKRFMSRDAVLEYIDHRAKHDITYKHNLPIDLNEFYKLADINKPCDDAELMHYGAGTKYALITYKLNNKEINGTEVTYKYIPTSGKICVDLRYKIPEIKVPNKPYRPEEIKTITVILEEVDSGDKIVDINTGTSILRAVIDHKVISKYEQLRADGDDTIKIVPHEHIIYDEFYVETFDIEFEDNTHVVAFTPCEVSHLLAAINNAIDAEKEKYGDDFDNTCLVSALQRLFKAYHTFNPKHGVQQSNKEKTNED